jgi:hypothetical protein
MIKETLEALSPGTRSFAELAIVLRIGSEDLKHRLAILESGGYIQKILGGDCASFICKGCGCSKGCTKAAGNAQSIIAYQLTAKGSKVLGRA